MKQIASYKLSSDSYKSYHQLTIFCTEWGISFEVEKEDVEDFDNLVDLEVFYMIYDVVSEEQWLPDYCIVTEDDVKKIVDEWGDYVFELGDSDKYLKDKELFIEYIQKHIEK